MSLLKAEGLVKVYGRRRVVDGVSFEVQQGEIVGLLGPNGAGKTTSFRMTCGLVIPNGGRVLLDDKEITKWPMFKRSRDGGMGYLAQEQSVFRKLTVQQNLLAIMELIGMPAKERRRRSEELMEQFDITRIRSRKHITFQVVKRDGLKLLVVLSPSPGLFCSMSRLLVSTQ
jgi:lipopolysaccharide export system ATP-binding protein